jgi:hypothetical protein
LGQSQPGVGLVAAWCWGIRSLVLVSRSLVLVSRSHICVGGAEVTETLCSALGVHAISCKCASVTQLIQVAEVPSKGARENCPSEPIGRNLPHGSVVQADSEFGDTSYALFQSGNQAQANIDFTKADFVEYFNLTAGDKISISAHFSGCLQRTRKNKKINKELKTGKNMIRSFAIVIHS